MDISKFQNSKKVGTGIWFCLGLMSVNCTTEEDRKYFINFMKTLSEVFPCKHCGEHFREYIKTHPLENIKAMTPSDYDVYNKNSSFSYIYDFHNVVNRRLKKCIFSYTDAIEYYANLDNFVCTDCGHSNNTDKNNTDKNISYKNSDVSRNITLTDTNKEVKSQNNIEIKSRTNKDVKSRANKEVKSRNNKHKYITLNTSPNNTPITPNNTPFTPNNKINNNIKSIITINSNMYNPIIKSI
jgi:hypothetical protein